MCVRSGMECRPRAVLPSATRRPKRQTENSPDNDVPGSAGSSGPQRSDVSSSPGIGEPLGSISVQTDAPTPLGRHAAESSPQNQQFGANRSAISLAMNMYQSLGTSAPLEASTIPGDGDLAPNPLRGPPWTLQSMQMPAPAAMEALIDVYFDKVDWFIWIFHKPSFVQQARQILSSSSWPRADMSKVLITLAVAALGLKCAMQDSSPKGQRLHSLLPCEPRKLMDHMIAEIRLHLIDLLEDNCIETVQVNVLLGALHIFHGSPSLAWATIGLSVRTSYALALHCDSDTNEITTQIRRRCWNHLTVADTFASQIYGRPASLDSAFSDLLPLAEIDDTAIDDSTEQYIRETFGSTVSVISFHWFKYKLYELTRKILSTFRLMRLHSPMTVDELQSLIAAVQDIEIQLSAWRNSLPPPLNTDNMSEDYLQLESLQEMGQNDGDGDMPSLRRLKLQAYVLQITYDAAVILAHRPLLEHKLSSASRQDVSRSSTEYVSRSFDISVKAALRTSRVPIMEFRNEFCMAFVFIHLFSAGVILCIPPTSHPYSNAAQEAKAGVFRIIQAAKALSPESQVARHADRLLSDLLKLSLHREVDMAFKEERQGLAPPEQPSQQEHERRLMSANNFAGPPADPCYDETLMPNMPHNADVTVGAVDEDWSLQPSFQNLMNANSSDLQPMDLPLDEAFGAFGQVMFNLVPDDPLNIWGWGKGSM
ncbi:uncharacterized protein E0L32_005824 [Thyridium curvatum]|uniref:Xylanolytic transcriptional activator regulatory domain-containing protein n=1 Tax=Thyridium curvatum TaxID=1093900 RepID=A0A507BBA5_9PEZI|nr:uncharacterized protein E0L32_005824 [Thyridium curvatum]TPX13880.1 hypothetical protein E0L32_005824 [Thyridium curvatum]